MVLLQAMVLLHANLHLRSWQLLLTAVWPCPPRSQAAAALMLSLSMLVGCAANGYWDLNIEDSPKAIGDRLSASDPSLNQVHLLAACGSSVCRQQATCQGCTGSRSVQADAANWHKSCLNASAG